MMSWPCQAFIYYKYNNKSSKQKKKRDLDEYSPLLGSIEAKKM